VGFFENFPGGSLLCTHLTPALLCAYFCYSCFKQPDFKVNQVAK
jgi:hypothetical protein